MSRWFLATARLCPHWLTNPTILHFRSLFFNISLALKSSPRIAGRFAGSCALERSLNFRCKVRIGKGSVRRIRGRESLCRRKLLAASVMRQIFGLSWARELVRNSSGYGFGCLGHLKDLLGSPPTFRPDNLALSTI